MKKTLFFLFFLSFSVVSFCQDFSNKGKEFWLVFPAHVPSSATAQMGLFITSDKNSQGTISVNGFTTTFSVTANQVTGPINIPYSVANVGTINTVVNKGIHVMVGNGQPPVVLYAHIYAGFRSEASLILPVNTLGKKYYSTNFYQLSTSGSKSQFNIVATEANTVVQYQLRENGVLNPVINTVNLPNPGDQIQVQNDQDLTGSLIQSIASGTGGCKKIAVFSGSSSLAIGSSSCFPDSYDPLFQQCYPVTSWGKDFGIVPFSNNRNGFHLRVMASEDNTTVNFNGTNINLNAGQFYPAETSNPVPFVSPMVVSADKPVSVSQYLMSEACAGAADVPGQLNPQGDPDMIILNPVEQNISDINIFSSNLQNIHTKYLNVYIKTTDAPNFRINGSLPNNGFTPMPQNNGYSFLRENLTTYSSTSFRLTSDSGFNAITYGMGDAESYGYSAGTNVRDLYTKLGVASPYNIETTPSICIGESFKFKISLPYLADSIKWDFGAAPNPPSVLVKYPPKTPDSTTSVNGKTLYWYSTPGSYNYATPNSYPVNITTYSQNTDGCGSVQELEFDLEVSGPPVAGFTNTTAACTAEPVQFTDATLSVKPTYKWSWNFGDPGSGAQNVSGLKNPVHIFSSPGLHTVTFSAITTAGCISSTISKTVNIPALPTAVIGGSASTCLNTAPPLVTFTGAGGTPPYTFSYTVDAGAGPGAVQTVSSSVGSAVTVNVPTNVAATYVYALVSVQNSSSATCSNPQTGTVTVKVNPLPTATIAGNTIVCQNAVSPEITFTGANGTAPYTFSYNIDGGTTKTITTVTGNAVKVNCPTNGVGQFKYTLLSVKDATLDNCSQNQNGVVTITVNPLPTATITGSAEVCLNGVSPDITLTGAGAPSPYTFSYTINNGPVQTVQTVTGNSIKLPAQTAVSGSFTYKLLSVREGSASACSQLQAGTALVQVDPLPVAAFNFSVPSCETAVIGFDATASTANAGTLTAWDWNFGDAANATTANPNTAHVLQPTHKYVKPGSYTVSLKITTDKGCTSTITKAVVINARPTAGFMVPEVCLLDPFAQFSDTSKISGSDLISGWDWDFGDAVNSTPVNPNSSTIKNARHTYILTGQYSVRQIVITDKGCRDTMTQLLTINGGNPSADFIALNATANCANQPVAIQNKSSIGSGNITRLEICWDNDGAPATIETDETPVTDRMYNHLYPNFNTPLSKTYHIRVRAYSGGVCFSDKIRSVTLNASPKLQFNALPNACINIPSYRLTAASEIAGVPGVGIYSGDGVSMLSAGVYDFNPALAGSGTHLIKYLFTTAAGGCRDSLSMPVTVYANPVVNAGPDAGVLAGGSITLQPVVTGSNLRYVWTWNPGSINGWLSNNLVKNPLASPLEDITYTLTVTGIGDCIASDDVFIKVLQAPKIPNTFSPNNDGINDFWEIKYLDSYPDNKVQVFTRTGQKVFESKGYKKAWDGNLNGKSLPVDTYYYIIEPGSGRRPITGYVTIIK